MTPLSISIVMPAFNEGLGLAAVLERVKTTVDDLRTRHDVEAIVVDDGSTDETAAILAAADARYPGTFRIRTHARNAGLVEALKTGVRAATAPIVVMLDADLSYAPEIVEPLAQTLAATHAGAVLASPYMRGGRVGNVPFDRLVASRVANWLLSACVGGQIKTFTGMVRAYDAALLRKAIERQTVGEFNAWLVTEMWRLGANVVEIPATLDWPPERTAAPSRLTAGKLWARTRLVVATARSLAAAQRFPTAVPQV